MLVADARAQPLAATGTTRTTTVARKEATGLLYNVFKYGIFVWAVRLLFRPRIEGAENIPRTGPAILVSNHISAGDTFLVPALIRRRLTFPAKQELFHGRGLKGRALAWFLRVGRPGADGPVRRPGQRGQHGQRAAGAAGRRAARHLSRKAPGPRTAASTRARPGSPGWCCRPASR